MLFTDLVGSTAWRARVGEVVADGRLAELEQASREVVESAGGRVVKSVGDGVMATFTSAVVAIDVAVALQSVAHRLAVGDSRACLRIGVSTGEMVRDGDDWLGAAAIEASRLCAEALGGDVLVADMTARLSAGRTAHVMRSLGERTLRGFENPVDVFELLLDHAARLTVPPALVDAAATPMVGRRAELDRMGPLLDAVQAGGSETLLVVGEPGVGKTRLVAALAADAAERGFTVMFGRCDEDVAAPYQPIVEALAPWLTELPSATLDRITGGGRDSIRRLWPNIVGGPAGMLGDPESERWRLFGAVTTLVESIAEEAPLLLVVDDLQWAEPSTLLLINNLARAVTPRLALVSTVRSTEAGTSRLGLPLAVHALDLDGLTAAEVGELVGRHAGGEPPLELASELCRQTDGNPFFLAALLAHLDDVAFVRRQDGTWLTAGELEAAGVPAGVRAVVGRRLDHIEQGTRRVLEVAAVCGLTFEERDVTAVLGGTMDASVDALDEAVNAGLVREERAGRYAFVHALVRHSVLDTLSLTRLARLHWRVGEALERLTSDRSRIGEVAAHYAAGEAAGDGSTVARTSVAAGQEAVARLAFDEAVEHFRAALASLDRAPPDPHLRFEVLTCLGGALNARSDIRAAEPLWVEAATIAEEARDPRRLFDALLGYGSTLRLSEEPELMRRIDVVLDLVGPADSPLRAMALGFKHMQRLRNAGGTPDQAELDAAVQMARRTGDLEALASTLRSRLWVLGYGPQALAMLRDAEELAAMSPTDRFMSGDPATVERDRFRALLRLGRRDEAEARLAANIIEAERSGLRLAVHTALVAQASIVIASGEFERGARLAAKARESANSKLPGVALGYGAQILACRMEQGRLDDVIPLLQQARDDRRIAVPAWRAMLANALADAGRHDDAANELDRLDEHIADGFAHLYGAPLAVRHVPEVCRQLGDRRRAAMLLPHVERWSGVILALNTSIDGTADRSVGHLLATLGRHDEADASYTRAAAMERSAGFPPLLARTEYWHARALLEHDAPGDRSRAADLLDEVVEITGRLGMELLHRQAGQLAPS